MARRIPLINVLSTCTVPVSVITTPCKMPTRGQKIKNKMKVVVCIKETMEKDRSACKTSKSTKKDIVWNILHFLYRKLHVKKKQKLKQAPPTSKMQVQILNRNLFSYWFSRQYECFGQIIDWWKLKAGEFC